MGSNSLYGPLDPAPDAGYVDAPPRVGFFTDTSVCIGCKACEVACKEWNLIPDDGFNLLGTSYDNTGGLTANSWRNVASSRETMHRAGGHTQDRTRTQTCERSSPPEPLPPYWPTDRSRW